MLTHTTLLRLAVELIKRGQYYNAAIVGKMAAGKTACTPAPAPTFEQALAEFKKAI